MLNSKHLRSLLFYSPVQLGIEYAVCFVIALIFANQSDVVVSSLWLMLALYAFRVANWVLKTITSIVMYYFTKRQRVRSVVSMFYKHKLPVTEGLEVYDDAMEEFAKIARQPDVSDDLRQFLYLSIAELSALKNGGQFILAMQAFAVIDTAIGEYVGEHHAREGAE